MRNFVLIGAPDDRGVAIVGGRVGAAKGPEAIRCAWYENLPSLKNRAVSVADAGNIPLANTQRETYEVLRKKIRGFHQEKSFPVLLGGGHDLSFGSLAGFLDAYPEGGIVNIDPHLDARPIGEEGKISSGSAYRLLLEKTSLQGNRLMEFGYQMSCNQPANLEYLKNKGVSLAEWPGDQNWGTIFEKSIRPFAQSVPALAVSFDMDSIQSEFAPGVSAPAKIGYTADEALALIAALKKFPNLKHFEIMETNPKYDPDGRTAKLAAHLLQELLIFD